MIVTCRFCALFYRQMAAMLADNFLNLEEAVKTWAKGEYDALANKKQKRLRDKESSKPHNYLNMTIDWSEVINVDKTLKVNQP